MTVVETRVPTDAIERGRLAERLALWANRRLSRSVPELVPPGQCAGGGQTLGRNLGAHLGLHAPGGNRVGQGRMVPFGLVGVGLGEVGHSLVKRV